MRVPASVGQRLLWLLAHYRDVGAGLNCPVLWSLRGPVEEVALQSALDGLVDRHEALRTTVSGRGRNLWQVVATELPARLQVVDLQRDVDPPAALQAAITAEFADPVDPAEGPLRATLWRTAAEEHVLCLTVHHLLTDAASCPVLFTDFARLYDAALGLAPDPPPPGPAYRQFSAEQQAQLDGGDLDAHLAYWRRQLRALELPALPRGPIVAPPTTLRVSADLGAGVVQGLSEVAQQRQTTIFSVLLALYYAQLHQLTASRDLCVASLFANRPARYAETVGFCANMLLLRTRLPRQARFTDLLAATHQTVIGAVRHQQVPYQVVGSIPAASDGTRAEDAVFQLIPEPLQSRPMGHAVAEALIPETIQTRFAFEFALVPSGGGYRIVLFHLAGLLPAGYPEAFVQGFRALAAGVTQQPGLTLAARGG